MKKLILILCFVSFIFFSCSTNKYLNEYLKNETLKNSNEGVTSILNAGKPDIIYVLDIYAEVDIRTGEHTAKTFSQIDYDNLKALNTKVKNSEFWTVKQQKNLGFQEITTSEYKKNLKIIDLEKKYDGNLIIYSVSNPILLKNNKTTIFLVGKSKGHKKHLETAIIVIKKENGKLKFVEKVYSQSEFD